MGSKAFYVDKVYGFDVYNKKEELQSSGVYDKPQTGDSDLIEPMCKFCMDYESQKHIYSSAEWNELADTDYHLSLVIKHYRKTDSTCCGTLTSGTYDIRYCPECGKKLIR